MLSLPVESQSALKSFQICPRVKFPGGSRSTRGFARYRSDADFETFSTDAKEGREGVKNASRPARLNQAKNVFKKCVFRFAKRKMHPPVQEMPLQGGQTG